MHKYIVGRWEKKMIRIFTLIVFKGHRGQRMLKNDLSASYLRKDKWLLAKRALVYYCVVEKNC